MTSRPPAPADARSRDLTPAQVAAVPVLVASGSVSETAAAVGVDPTTVRRWLTLPGFRAEYRAAARAAAVEAVSALLACQGRAVSALVAALDDGSPATRVRAARALLEVGRVALDDDLTERLDELEAAVADLRAGTEVTSWPAAMRA